MPFSFTNTPSTFQALMNDIVKPFFCRFILVSFDDILVYNASWAEHLQYVKAIFQVLWENHMSLKKMKCSFGEPFVHYLRHVINAEDVGMLEQSGGSGGLAPATHGSCPTRVLGTRGLLPQIHCGPRCGRNSPDGVAQA